MEEQLVTFETARIAKEKNFNWYTDKAYILDKEDGDKIIDNEWEQIIEDNPNVFEFVGYAPTQSFLQKWLREIHEISIKVDDFYTESKVRFDYNICKLGSQEDNPKGIFETYEKALEAGLQEALNLI